MRHFKNFNASFLLKVNSAPEAGDTTSALGGLDVPLESKPIFSALSSSLPGGASGLANPSILTPTRENLDKGGLDQGLDQRSLGEGLGEAVSGRQDGWGPAGGAMESGARGVGGKENKFMHGALATLLSASTKWFVAQAPFAADVV